MREATKFLRDVALSDMSDRNIIKVDDAYLHGYPTELIITSVVMSAPRVLPVDTCFNDNEWAVSPAHIMHAHREYEDHNVITEYSVDEVAVPIIDYRMCVFRPLWIHPSQMACSFSEFNCNMCPYVLLCQLGKIPIAFLSFLSVKGCRNHNRPKDGGRPSWVEPSLTYNNREIVDGILHTTSVIGGRPQSPITWDAFKHHSSFSEIRTIVYASPGMYARYPILSDILETRKNNQERMIFP